MALRFLILLKVGWYWNLGYGFYLSEETDLDPASPNWEEGEVLANSTVTVYKEPATASGVGRWKGELTFTTDTGQLTHTLCHKVSARN